MLQELWLHFLTQLFPLQVSTVHRAAASHLGVNSNFVVQNMPTAARSILIFQFLDPCEEGIWAKVIKTDSTSQLEPEGRVEGFPCESSSISHPGALFSQGLSRLGLVFLLSMYCQARLGKFNLLCSQQTRTLYLQVCLCPPSKTDWAKKSLPPWNPDIFTALIAIHKAFGCWTHIPNALLHLASCVSSSFLTKSQAARTQSNYYC